MIIALSSCYDNFEKNVETDTTDPVKYVTNTTLSGLVTDENGQTLAGGVYGSFGSEDYNNEVFSIFRFEGQQIDKYNELITLTKNNQVYYYTVPTVENEINYSKKAIFTTIDNTILTQGNNTTINNTLDINTQANSFQSHETAYSGEVTILHHTIDVSNKWHLATMPGNNTGVNTDGSPAYINFDEVIHLQFTDGTDLLDVVEGSVQGRWSNKSDDQKVWHYDTNVHKWIALNTTTNTSTFDIISSGYYAIASSQYYVYATGSVSTDGTAIANIEVQLEADNKIITTTRTASNGQWVAVVPSISQLTATTESTCDEVASILFETVEQDVVAGSIEMSQINSQVYTIEGAIKSCDDQGIVGSFIEIKTSTEELIYYLDKSIFRLRINACSDDITVRSINIDGTESGAQIEWELNNNSQDLHTLYACNAAQSEYMTLRIDGGSKQYYNGVSSLENGRTIIDFSSTGAIDNTLKLWFTGTDRGVFDDNQINILIDDQLYDSRGFALDCTSSQQGCGFTQFDVSQYEETNGWIRGYFKGRFWIKSYSPLNAGYKDVEGEYQIRRDF